MASLPYKNNHQNDHKLLPKLLSTPLSKKKHTKQKAQKNLNIPFQMDKA